LHIAGDARTKVRANKNPRENKEGDSDGDRDDDDGKKPQILAQELRSAINIGNKDF